MKTCRRCGELKPETEFGTHPSWCKACVCIYSASYYKERVVKRRDAIDEAIAAKSDETIIKKIGSHPTRDTLLNKWRHREFTNETREERMQRARANGAMVDLYVESHPSCLGLVSPAHAAERREQEAA